jgi:hypothetical protein
MNGVKPVQRHGVPWQSATRLRPVKTSPTPIVLPGMAMVHPNRIWPNLMIEQTARLPRPRHVTTVPAFILINL